MLLPALPCIADIAPQVAQGRLSALAVAEAVIARLEAYGRIQPEVWISRFDNDTLRSMASAIDARVAAAEHLPLAGVPFAIKDNIDLAGLPTTAACPPSPIARTAAPMWWSGPSRQARCRWARPTSTSSPPGWWAHARPMVPAVQCTIAPISVGIEFRIGGGGGRLALALGTDTAGSGRVPAALNGLVGLKPSKGRGAPAVWSPCRTLDCITVLAHDVQDAALVDDCLGTFGMPPIPMRAARTASCPASARKRPASASPAASAQFSGRSGPEALFAQAIARTQAFARRSSKSISIR
jgi:allophanate hydrolase